jgi:SAM-dependent methyltransferase
VNADLVQRLTSPAGVEALLLADRQSDPSSLAAAAALRAAFPPELASAALSQTELRRRAQTKFGPSAARMLFTRDGLEQATRPAVAGHHASRLVAAGAKRVVDLGCGIGADAMAFAAAGLDLVAVERDPATAAIARHNLTSAGTAVGSVEVVVGDAEELAASLLTPGTAVFCDPARRTANRRLWRVQDFTPSWPFVLGLLDGTRAAGVKLGPALPHSFIPAGVHAEWVSHRSDTIEVCLWSGTDDPPDSRAAMLLPDHRLLVRQTPPALEVSGLRRYLYEPDGAVIRAGAIGVLGRLLDASLVDPQIAYLTGDRLLATPYAEPFEIVDRLPYNEKVLRRWVSTADIGTLEIKKRGIDVDPAELRKRLRPRGSQAATLVITRTPHGAQVLVVRRVAPPGGAGT